MNQLFPTGIPTAANPALNINRGLPVTPSSAALPSAFGSAQPSGFGAGLPSGLGTSPLAGNVQLPQLPQFMSRMFPGGFPGIPYLNPQFRMLPQGSPIQGPSLSLAQQPVQLPGLSGQQGQSTQPQRRLNVDFRPVVVQNQYNFAPLGSGGINANMVANSSLNIQDSPYG